MDEEYESVLLIIRECYGKFFFLLFIEGINLKDSQYTRSHLEPQPEDTGKLLYNKRK